MRLCGFSHALSSAALNNCGVIKAVSAEEFDEPLTAACGPFGMAWLESRHPNHRLNIKPPANEPRNTMLPIVTTVAGHRAPRAIARRARRARNHGAAHCQCRPP